VLGYSGYKAGTLATKYSSIFSLVDQSERVPYSARGDFEGEGQPVPHVVVRIYSDAGPLVAVARDGEDEIRDIMHNVPGFRLYGIVDTGGGILSVTSCDDNAGTDASNARAAEFVKANLPPGVSLAPPQIIEGEGVVRIELDGAPFQGAHVAVRIWSEQGPPGIYDRQEDIRKRMTAVDGFYTYAVVDTGSGRVSFLIGKDKATTDEVARRMGEWVRAQWPDFSRPAPQVIEGEGLYRFTAVPAAA
jgi:hypothetical protein